MRYWDSSAIVATILRDDASAVVRALLEADDAVATWWGTRVECAAALFRRWREGHLSLAAVEDVLKGLGLSARGWREVPATEALRASALRVLRIHNLRTGDALQLAAAVEWAERRPGGLEFVTLDEVLGRAAALEGFSVLPQ